jgi:ferrochelatase
VGVVLFQLGGPDARDAVEPFLYNLFCDPDIIPLGMLGAVVRKPLAWWIAQRRAQSVAHHYDRIGGHSPIRALTERQARALETALAPAVEPHATVAMRYWRPLTLQAVAEIERLALDELVLLPLYPHYSFATTRSSLKEWERCYKPRPFGPQVHVVENFHDHPLYIQALVEKIALCFRQFARRDEVHLVFSAHGLPMSLVEEGDPYPKQVERTVQLVRERGDWSNPWTLCYQSRVGRQKWLEPSLTSTIEKLAASGVREMLVIPISFVTEHIETLFEINIEAREEAEKLGVKTFRMMPAVGDSPLFIGALADLVMRAVGTASRAAVPVR